MLIAANFKSFHTRKSTKKYIKKLEKFIAQNHISDEICVIPPFSALRKSDTISIAAGNLYPAFEGSYTGEITLSQLNEFEISNVLIGHSERREILNETREFIVQKFEFAKETDLRVIYCIGEPFEVREKGFEAVKEYLLEQFDGIDTNYENLIIAYEPIWAIGTGLSATKEQINEVLYMLKTHFNKKLLYGGSVNDKNSEEILSIPSCDGLLIGSYSLKVENLCKIIEISKRIQDVNEG